MFSQRLATIVEDNLEDIECHANSWKLPGNVCKALEAQARICTCAGCSTFECHHPSPLMHILVDGIASVSNIHDDVTSNSSSALCDTCSQQTTEAASHPIPPAIPRARTCNSLSQKESHHLSKTTEDSPPQPDSVYDDSGELPRMEGDRTSSVISI